MSVAFRRESDEEHLEPKFELPIPPGPNFVTANGLAQTRLKVTELETLLPQLTEETDITATRRQLRYWRTRQATAQLVPLPDGTHVAFGCTVEFRLKGRDQTITIVGDDEADPASGIISFSAPLCRAMMDAEVGDVVEFAGVPDAIEVLAIRATQG
ncbi:GreA/GreB family elongation factor [Sphingobium subterraneum]|uniref:Transcription elongation GreA/GreB family factor n=1 Tax=Sphingobium subterraneum TaxID=627688 RepID=A0A841J111_9SPHN|nr:GreA/GreB family elongation factor [Sphingobium subterraneum]MBB6124032.1 transcription elongation GreA/GreB family factor [Sphingobium subterraneum]